MSEGPGPAGLGEQRALSPDPSPGQRGGGSAAGRGREAAEERPGRRCFQGAPGGEVEGGRSEEEEEEEEGGGGWKSAPAAPLPQGEGD